MKVMPAVLAIALATLAAPARAQQSHANASDQPPATRLFLMPTGHTLPASRGYVDVIAAPGVAQFQVAATDWFSLGGGTPAYMFGGARAVWLTPKVAVVKAQRLHAAVGAIQFFGGDAGGLAYGVATAGSRAHSMTLGVMYGYGDADGVGPAVLIGFEREQSKHTRMMFEATVFRSGGLVIVGVRRGGKKFTSDFGMAIPIAEDLGLFAFPIVNFGWTF
jgi:hypothetical protein